MLATWGFTAALLLCRLDLNNAQVYSDNCADDATSFDLATGVDLTGKVAVITGGDSGIGLGASEAFAKHGATLIVAGHTPAKCAAVAHNLSVAFGADVRPLAIDLANFSSVREFAMQFYRQVGDTLDFLINDAGMTSCNPDYLTMDGFEKLFQINYLGHFLLTELLLPALRKGGSSRIVNMASGSQYQACNALHMPPGCLKDWTLFPPPVLLPSDVKPHPSYYGFSKFVLVQHAAELARREADNGIMAFSVIPGMVYTPQFDRSKKNLTKLCIGQKKWQHVCPYNSEQGAAVIAYTAFHAKSSGACYDRVFGCGEAYVDQHGFDPARRPELYRRSLQWVGLAPPARDVKSAFQTVEKATRSAKEPPPMFTMYSAGVVGGLLGTASVLFLLKLSKRQVAVTPPSLLG